MCAQRTREIGIRMVIGAQSRGVIRMILSHALGRRAAGIEPVQALRYE